MSFDRPHNGYVLDTTPLQFPNETHLEYSPNSPQLYVLLDEIMDPQNLGSILRTSRFFGVTGVVIGKNKR